MVTTVSSPSTNWEVRAKYFETEFGADLVLRLFPEATPLHSSPLLIEYNGCYVVFLSYGAVLFWIGNEATSVEILIAISKARGTKDVPVQGQTELFVRLNQENEQVNFKDIWLKELSIEHIKIISETLGQSVALQHCDQLVQELLTQSGPAVQELKTRGRIKESSPEILKLIGATLEMREKTLARLALIDAPLEAWRSERLSRLHAQLDGHLKIKQRLATLQTKLDYLLDLSDILMNFIRHREGHRLEWIIIILIVIEVVFSTYHFFAGS